MLRKAKVINGYSLAALDGEIGQVKDSFFDDAGWVLRYLVADTGAWLPKRRVLISPFAISEIGIADRVVRVGLRREQIENQPSVDDDKPFSRQMEEQYHRFYDWPFYWAGPYLWGPLPTPNVSSQPGPGDVAGRRSEPLSGDPHLRSANEVRGYHIQGLDDSFGHIADFVFDDQVWAIRYMIVDTGTWWTGKMALLPVSWISSIDWKRSGVNIDLDRTTLRRAPEFDPNGEISRDYESRLFAFYNRDPYWSASDATGRARQG